MIYDMIFDCVHKNAERWYDLALAFKQLAQSLDPTKDQIKINFLDNNSPPGLAQLANNQKSDAVEAARIPVVELKLGLEDWIDTKRPNTVSLAALLTDAAARLSRSLADLQIIFIDPFELKFSPYLPSTHTPKSDNSTEVMYCLNKFHDLEASLIECLEEIQELQTPGGGSEANLNEIRGSVDNIASYPILTSDFGLMPTPSAASPGGSGGVSYQRTVDGALRAILGRLPKANDTRSFMAALNQSFQIVQFEGHTQLSWSPRSYAGQTELGGSVTGAQASLYTRATVALDNVLPLLSGLFPLLPEFDEQEVEAARAIVRNQLMELVNALGVEGGPLVERVDNLFELLLDQTTTGISNAVVQDGKLGYLQYVMGLKSEQVNTLDEETNVTNFLTIRDYITSIRDGWTSFRNQWLGKDLGTRLVLLARALSVTAESVDEIYAAMDSVFVGIAERQVASFSVGAGRSLRVEELLSWIQNYASEEGPGLVHDGGRRGVESIVPTAQRLAALTQSLLSAISSGDPGLPSGLRHPRVRHPLQELYSYLRQVEQISQSIRRPVTL